MTDSNAATGRLANIRMLIVDDNDVNRLVLKGMAEHEGALVVSCENGREAVAALEQAGSKAFDVVITDIQMPVMDGYEAARRIAQLAPGLPIVGQTAHAFDEDRDKCLAAGMVGHIAKPIDLPALVRLLLQLAAQRRHSA